MDAALRRILDEHLALRVDLPVAISSPRSLAGVSAPCEQRSIATSRNPFWPLREAPLHVATTPSRYTGPKSSVMLLLATIREQQRLRQLVTVTCNLQFHSVQRPHRLGRLRGLACSGSHSGPRIVA